MIVVVEKTPSSSELDELTAQLRTVTAADQRLDKSNVRIWFQNRRREQRQMTSSSMSSAAAATNDVRGCRQWSVSSVGHGQWPASGDTVMEAVMRLGRYCSAPRDITNHFDC